MDIRSCIERIRRHEKALVLFNLSEPGFREELASFFATQNVAISAERTASGRPEDVAVLSDRDRVLAVVDVPMLRELVTDVPTGPGNVGIADGAYEAVLGHLKETTFTSYDREQLLYASREIEDRARRTRGGTIHTGFQRCSVMANQRESYVDLAARGVDVHAYGQPDVPPPDLGDGQVHAIENDEIAGTWFVVFDGDGVEAQKTALLAEERPEGFYGAWTYDPRLVDRVHGYLMRRYVRQSEDARTDSD
ncbi:MAG: DICT sensory domain-containing protein [Halovenus sp.]